MEIGGGRYDLQGFEAMRSRASQRLAGAPAKLSLEELVRSKRDELHKGSPAPAPLGAGYGSSQPTASLETKEPQLGRFIDLVA